MYDKIEHLETVLGNRFLLIQLNKDIRTGALLECGYKSPDLKNCRLTLSCCISCWPWLYVGAGVDCWRWCQVGLISHINWFVIFTFVHVPIAILVIHSFFSLTCIVQFLSCRKFGMYQLCSIVQSGRIRQWRCNWRRGNYAALRRWDAAAA